MLKLKLKLQYFGHLMRRAGSFEKILMLGKIEDGRRREQQRMRWLDDITNAMDLDGTTKFDGHDFEQAPGVGDGLGSLACYSPWDGKESDTTERLN